MTYRRWYDTDPKLSAVVHAMESLNRDTQIYFADKLYELSEGLLTQRGGDDYLAGLDARKKEGLTKARSKHRWYDQNESLHRAFNNLYALPGGDRRDIAIQLETPIQIVEGYEKHCARHGSNPEMRVIEEILRSSFMEGRERARKLYSLYLYDYSAATHPSHPEVPEGIWSQLLKRVQEALS
ncbi:MAG: hypothetical protein K0Q50_699 [Vampirovibrio sp.]|jgi:hypothetical protein|nr:hypothetical protein [Vampirovibrio sp.]